MSLRITRLLALVLVVFGSIASAALAADPAPPKLDKPPFPYVWAKAWHIPKETTTDESGYFSLCEGLDKKLYVGTAAYGRNAYLVQFDPASEKMKVVVDVHKTLGLPLTPTGYAAQAKIHTRNFVGPSGTVYVGSKQGYRQGPDDKAEYPGGYVLTYDPKTDETKSLGMPYKGQGVIDVVADESRGLLYVVTCEDQHWMLYDAKSAKYRELGPMLVPYATTLIDAKGRANTINKFFQLAQYDPATDKVRIRNIMVGHDDLKQSVSPGIFTWNLAADGKTAYLVMMNDPHLLKIDLSSDGDAVEARNLGSLIDLPGFDSRSSLTIAPDGKVYVLAKINNNTGFGGGQLHFLTSYDPKKNKIENHGVLAVKNPDFFGRPLGSSGAVDESGKTIPWTHGYHKLPDGTLTPLHAHMALVAAADGTLWATILYPYSLLKIELPKK